ncbi:MAG: 23S rRNA (guanosine(2251)-2'-O)-methyltransferase RlmB [Desulfobacterales bacterium]
MAKTEVLYGIHPVCEALRAGRRKVLALYAVNRPSQRVQAAVQLARQAQVAVETLSGDQLQALAGTPQHQGLAARVGAYPFADLPTALDHPAEGGAEPLVVILDNVVDPHNLGALIRTGHCAGVAAMVIPRDRAAAPTPTVSKASAGALEHVRLVRVANIAAALRKLKDRGFWVVGMDRAGDRSVFDMDLRGPTAIVVGGEGRGIRPLVKTHCDFLVSIPQLGRIDSLNASVAGAIVIYEALRQRLGGIPLPRTPGAPLP